MNPPIPPTDLTLPADAPSGRPEPPVWEPGRLLLGEYRVEQLLGQGGMGTVYLVRREADGEPFAVKTLRGSSLGSPEERRQLLQELRTWIDLPEHPNLTACRFCRTVEGRMAIFAEYVAGGSLADQLRPGEPVELETALDQAIQVARGLAMAHRREVVHRDVKPANVLVTGDGVAKVTDFGLAGLGSASPSGSSPMTAAYCSPEQARGESTGPGSDLWSLGLTLLHLATGELSWYRGDAALEVLDDLGSSLPDSLVEVLKRCFQEEPASRWVDAGALEEALIEVHRVELDRPYPRPAPSMEPVEIEVEYERESTASMRWADPRKHLERALELVGENPDRIDALLPKRQGSQEAQALADLEAYQIAQDLLADAMEREIREARDALLILLTEQALIHEVVGDVPGALDCYDRVMAICRAAPAMETDPGLQIRLAKALLSKGIALCQAAREEEALPLYRQAGEIWTRLTETGREGSWRISLGLVAMNSAVALHSVGRPDESLENYQRAIRIFRELLEEEADPAVEQPLAMCYFNLAGLLLQRDPEGGLEAVAKALKIWRRTARQETGPEVRSKIATAYCVQADCLRFLGRIEEGLAQYGRAIGLMKELVWGEGQNDQRFSLALLHLNRAFLLSDPDPAAALEDQEQGIRILDRLIRIEGQQGHRISLGMALVDRGQVRKRTGDTAGARADTEQAGQIFRDLVAKDGTSRARGYLQRAEQLLADLGPEG